MIDIHTILAHQYHLLNQKYSSPTSTQYVTLWATFIDLSSCLTARRIHFETLSMPRWQQHPLKQVEKDIVHLPLLSLLLMNSFFTLQTSNVYYQVLWDKFYLILFIKAIFRALELVEIQDFRRDVLEPRF